VSGASLCISSTRHAQGEIETRGQVTFDCF
jgi:hypothetical protein